MSARRVAADTSGHGWDEGRTSSTRLVRGSDAAFGSDGASVDSTGKWHGDSGAWGIGRVPPTDGAGDLRTDWGPYGPAIARWAHACGRAAPAPTIAGTKGQPKLNPRFVEWLMGLPPGWVTDVPGISVNQQLRMLGNGVVPAQAAAAIHWLTRL